jgi:hypothetical protein
MLSVSSSLNPRPMLMVVGYMCSKRRKLLPSVSIILGFNMEVRIKKTWSNQLQVIFMPSK